MSGQIQNNPSIQQYLQVRAQLHNQIFSQNLLGASAVQDDDQVTLKQDVVVKDTTYKAGSTYSLNPYAGRTHHNENLTYEKGGERVIIQHEFSPHTFSTQESLQIRTVSTGPNGFGSGEIGVNDTSYGFHPSGWMQKIVTSEGDGYILKGYPFEKTTTA